MGSEVNLLRQLMGGATLRGTQKVSGLGQADGHIGQVRA